MQEEKKSQPFSSLLFTVTTLQTHATSYSFDSSCTLQRRKEENLIENQTPFPIVWQIHTETSNLRTLKMMLRDLNEIVRSWMRLQYTIQYNAV